MSNADANLAEGCDYTVIASGLVASIEPIKMPRGLPGDEAATRSRSA